MITLPGAKRIAVGWAALRRHDRGFVEAPVWKSWIRSGRRSTGTLLALLTSIQMQGCDCSLSVDCENDLRITLDRYTIELPPTGVHTIFVAVAGFRGDVSVFASDLQATKVTFPQSLFTAPGTVRMIVEPALTPGLQFPVAGKVTITAGGGGLASVATLTVSIVKGFTPPAPTTVPATIGNAATATIGITRHPRHNGPISFTSNPPSGLTVDHPPTSTSTATLTVSVPSTTQARIYPLTVFATDGFQTESFVVDVDVRAAPVPADFSVNPNVSALTTRPGSNIATGVNINRTGGFADPVSLEMLGLPGNVQATFDENPATGTSTTVRLNVLAGAQVGLHSLTLRGTSGNLVRGTPMTLQIDPPPSIALLAQPSSLTIAAGGAGSVNLGIQRVSVSGVVSLDAPVNSGGLGLAFAPAVAGSTTPLNITVPSNTTPGPYSIQMRAILGVLSSTATITVTVTAPLDFTVSAMPAAVSTRLLNTTGQSSTIQINRSAGFVDPVNVFAMSLPPGVNATFTPTTTPGNTSVVRVTARGFATPGTYPITVRGTSGGIVRTTLLTVTVADSNPGASDSWLDAQDTVDVLRGAPAGSTALFALVRHSLTPNTPTFVVTGLPAGVTVTVTQGPYSSGVIGSIRFVATAGTVPGNYTVTLSSPAATNGSVTITLRVFGS
ncbi:MAG: hypothetical protein ACT4OZ_15135 [Gemmatimonadota bacterium]